MGSLMPGWDSAVAGVPPRELQERDDRGDQGSQGYFSRLEQARTMRRSSTVGRDSDDRSLRRAQSERVPDVLDVTSPLASLSTHTHHRLPEQSYKSATMPSSAAKLQYQATDWSAELTSLQPRLARWSLDSRKTSQPGTPAAGWWSTMDSGALNSPTAEESQRDVGQRSVRLDFSLTGTGLGHSLL